MNDRSTDTSFTITWNEICSSYSMHRNVRGRKDNAFCTWKHGMHNIFSPCTNWCSCSLKAFVYPRAPNILTRPSSFPLFVFKKVLRSPASAEWIQHWCKLKSKLSLRQSILFHRRGLIMAGGLLTLATVSETKSTTVVLNMGSGTGHLKGNEFIPNLSDSITNR